MDVTIKHQGKQNSKIRQISVNDKILITPTYFPSISSAEIRADMEWLTNFMIDEEYPRLLVSSYDIAKLSISQQNLLIKKLDTYSANGGFLMIDSGEFERYYSHSKIWTKEQYVQIINKMSSDFFFGFDRIPDLETKTIEIKNEITDSISISNSLIMNNHCFTILHGRDLDEIRDITKFVIDKYSDLKFIAITDRECGKTLQDQYRTITMIRQICNDSKKDIIIHVLGCGNPLSMTVLSYAGADSFDAVDWSRWILDNKTWQCSNLSHVKLLECSCLACSSEKITDEKIRAYQHNLIFYQDFITRLQNAISKDYDLISFLKSENLDQNVIEILANSFKVN
ncbi:hypothetical protein [Nitrosarchaeum sp. AC2]|uniref:hypothetical protein n=1 Tax=Nitrosarchaeum sp. AC2 TaxID=2259673 RepID=UPI0015CAC08A|nr:hypothetical protein [Nitrosarchaeum sp. AC2]QLH10264.1 hypothetical protein DSQ20_01145 [Nitrosarchaeum sp. AC2]